jgi:copper homeostasis protein
LTPPTALCHHAGTLGVAWVAMARPTAGASFVLDEAEVEATLVDAQRVLDAGAPGVVFGGLSADGRVHRPLIQRMVTLAGARTTVFHRAFDAAADRLEALDTLIELGVTRVLTAGGPGPAAQHTEHLAHLVHRAQGRIEILAGGGVRAHNARQLLDTTGVEQLHARASVLGVIAALRAATLDHP